MIPLTSRHSSDVTVRLLMFPTIEYIYIYRFVIICKYTYIYIWYSLTHTHKSSQCIQNLWSRLLKTLALRLLSIIHMITPSCCCFNPEEKHRSWFDHIQFPSCDQTRQWKIHHLYYIHDFPIKTSSYRGFHYQRLLPISIVLQSICLSLFLCGLPLVRGKPFTR